MMFRLPCVLCSFRVLAALPLQRDVSAIELRRAATDMAQHVAQDHAHDYNFGGGFTHVGYGGHAVAPNGVAPPPFDGVDTFTGAAVITLRPPVEKTTDIERVAAALGDARSSKRSAYTIAYNADWQRMLDGEKRALGKILQAELLLPESPARSL